MRRLFITALALALFAACGPGDVGQACRAGAAEEDCIEGAVCTPDPDDRTEPPPPGHPNDYGYTCRTICEIAADCEEGFACRRVEGSMLSSCQPTGEEEPTGEEGSAP